MMHDKRLFHQTRSTRIRAFEEMALGGFYEGGTDVSMKRVKSRRFREAVVHTFHEDPLLNFVRYGIAFVDYGRGLCQGGRQRKGISHIDAVASQ